MRERLSRAETRCYVFFADPLQEWGSKRFHSHNQIIRFCTTNGSQTQWPDNLTCPALPRILGRGQSEAEPCDRIGEARDAGLSSGSRKTPRTQSWEEIRKTNQSRRACPELVERGRLKITQDAILGCFLSPCVLRWSIHYTAQLTQDHVLGNFQPSLRDFSMPRENPGLRPGLFSAVPAGLMIASDP